MTYFPKCLTLLKCYDDYFLQSHSEVKAPRADPSNHRLFWQLMSYQTTNDGCLKHSDSPLRITTVSLDCVCVCVSSLWVGRAVYIMSSMGIVISEKANKAEQWGNWMNEEPVISTQDYISVTVVTLKLIKLLGTVGLWRTQTDLLTTAEVK